MIKMWFDKLLNLKFIKRSSYLVLGLSKQKKPFGCCVATFQRLGQDMNEPKIKPYK